MKEIEKKVYDYIMDKSCDGIPPSIREICAALDIKSTSTAARYVDNLVGAGLLEKVGGRNRAIKPVSVNSVRVPVIDSLKVKDDYLSSENIKGYVTLSFEKEYKGKLFALNINDESMIKSGILCGDTLIAETVEHLSSIESGSFVIAWIDDEYKVRRFYKENGKYRLSIDSDNFETMITDECIVAGKVLTVIRYL